MELAQCYEKALGEKILPEEGLAELCSPAPLADEPDEDADQVLDELEAWMPEAIAVVKLRGFVYDFGGEVLDSQPGRIRFRLPAPATTPEAAPWGLWALLGFGKRTAPPLPNALLELRMQKTTTGLQNQLQIKVLMHPEQNARQEQATDWQYWCGQVCRDLRAYLISR